MFYLLGTLTFLATLLFYSLYPRADGVSQIDIPHAKIAVQELISQHSAALQAGSLVVEASDGSRKMKYEDWIASGQMDFSDFLPPNMVQTNNPPISTIICVDNKTASLTNNCARSQFNEENEDYGTTDFLVTYTTFSDLDPMYGTYLTSLTPRALGKKMRFIEYRDDSTDGDGVQLSTYCGILAERSQKDGRDFDPNNADFSLSNTRTKTVNLPKALTDDILNEMNEEYLICISRLSVAYNPSCAKKDSITCGQHTHQGCYWNTNTSMCQSGIIKPLKK